MFSTMKITIWVTLFQTMCANVADAKVVSWRFRQRTGLRLKSHQDEFSLPSLAACCSLCAQHECTALSWHSGSGRCLLTYKKVPYAGEEEKYFVSNDGWVSSNRVVNPVFKAEDRGGQTVYSADRASQVCRRLTSTIATRQDLVQMSKRGIHLCKCGWFAGGIATTLQYFEFGCLPWVGQKFVICHLPGSSNVWCLP